MDVLPLGLVGDGALRAAAVADREVTRMEGVRLDHLVQYLGQVAADWEPPVWQGPGAEQAIRLGGAGTPEVPEFAVVEVATALGLTQPAATVLCADVLDLAFRLPRLASAVRAGVLAFSRAQVIARRTRVLSREQVALVQERLCQTRDTHRGPAPVVAVVAMSRLRAVVDQAVVTVRGPESQSEAEQRVAASLFVQVSPTEPGAADVAARLEVTDAVRLDRRLDQVAGWLTQVGDSRPKTILRAVALGLLADPALLRALDDLRKQHRDTTTTDTAVTELRDVGAGLQTPPAQVVALERPQPALPDVGLPEEPQAARPAQPPLKQPQPALPDVNRPEEPQTTLSESPQRAPSETEWHDEPQPPPQGAAHEDPSRAAQPVLPGVPPPLAAAAKPLAGVAGCPPGLLEKFTGLTSTVLYLHLDQASGTWCEERAGVLTRAQARAVVGHSNVSVRPVLDLAEPLSYTGYVAPPLLKEQLALFNAGYCPFPYCHRRARAGDVDHQLPDRKGGPTATWNTHRPCRKHHRAKDKGGWKVTTPTPGVWVWTSPAGAVYLVTNGTTTQLNGVSTRTSAPAPTYEDVATTLRQAAAVAEGVHGAESADCADGGHGGEREHNGNDSSRDEEPAIRAAIRDRSADTRTSTKGSWAPSWDPWDDIDPLTLDEHDLTYGFINTA